MKTSYILKTILFTMLITVMAIFMESCEMPATGFDGEEEAIYYSKHQKSDAPVPDSTIRVMTWNMRFGIGRGSWFGDACGDRVIYSEKEILDKLKSIVEHINLVNPDVLLLQEVDINSTRSAYVDQLRWILDRTAFNYAAYGLQWKAQFIPSDGLGRIEEANAIMSRWPITDAKRIQLVLRKDQDGLTRYFYERCCMVKAKINIPDFKSFYAVNIHASAFATDDSKHKHLLEFKNLLDGISSSGIRFVAGGDLNTLPPGSDSTDYCIEDMCPGESFHHPGDNPQHKEGSNYSPESEWLLPFYNAYKSAVPLSVYLANQESYFTHTTRPYFFWDRTLDYLFTNYHWRNGSVITHQDFFEDSDHAPVSAEFALERN